MGITSGIALRWEHAEYCDYRYFNVAIFYTQAQSRRAGASADMGISDMDKATEADLAADIALRVAGAAAVRRLRKRCQNQHELARLLSTTQQEVSRVMRTRARASRRVMRDAIKIDELVVAAIEASIQGAIEGRVESMKRASVAVARPCPPFVLAPGAVVKA